MAHGGWPSYVVAGSGDDYHYRFSGVSEHPVSLVETPRQLRVKAEDLVPLRCFTLEPLPVGVGRFLLG